MEDIHDHFVGEKQESHREKHELVSNYHNCSTSWCPIIQFSSLLGEMIQFDSYFSDGWFNHQLENVKELDFLNF